MNNLIYNYVTTNEQLLQVQAIAETVWNEHYGSLLSQDQINYMLNKFQSTKAIKSSIIKDNYKYYLLSYNNNYCGYIGIKEEEDKLFLSKLYLLKEYRHKGLAKKAFTFLKCLSTNKNLGSIYLTVNKHNYSSIEAYKSIGFKIIDSVVSDIGNNYVMDDYIMELNL